jgi:histidinol-phosphate phosphatase family protein
MSLGRVAFLDRDGVINKKLSEDRYVTKWEEFEFLPGSVEAVRLLSEKGFIVIVITNQRGIGRGMMTEEDLIGIHNKMVAEIEAGGGSIDKIYFCPHDKDDNCDCRKPKAGMLFNAIDDLKASGIEVDMKKSYFFGDSEKDIIAGRTAGVRTVAVGKPIKGCDLFAEDLLSAVNQVIEETESKG